jgi:hypothetical protein
MRLESIQASLENPAKFIVDGPGYLLVEIPR